MGSCTHQQNTIRAGECIRCQKSLCPDCLKEWGYYCSPECREIQKKESSALLSEMEKSELQRMDRRSNRIAFWLVRVLPLVLISWGIIHITLRLMDPSGKVRWKLPIEEEPIQIKSSADVIYVLSNPMTLYARSLKDGTLLWSKHDLSSHPAFPFLEINNGILFLATQKEIIAFDTSSGEILSKYECSGWLSAAPMIRDDSIFLITQADKKDPWTYLRANSTRDYSLIKLSRTQWIPEWIQSVPCLNPSKMIASSNAILIDDVSGYDHRRVMAIDLESGKKIWEYTLERSYIGTLDPLVTENHILLADPGMLICLDESGKKIWSCSLPQDILQWGLSSQKEIIVTSGKKITCLDSHDGEKLWQQSIGNTEGYFAVSDKIIYIAGSYVAPKKHVPDERWVELLKPIGFPSIEFPKDYVGHRLYAIQSETGKILWQRDHIKGIPLLELGHLYLYNAKFSMNLLDAGKLIGETSHLAKTHGHADLRWRFEWEGSSRLADFSKNGIVVVNTEINFGPGDIMTGGPKEPPKYSLVCINP